MKNEGGMRGGEKMQESTCRKIKKSLYFERSGETFSVEIELKNVSPDISKRSLRDHLSSLYKSAFQEVSQ